jgi:hypothetical protein
MKVNFTEKQLLDEYNKNLDEMLDFCDWVTHVDGNEVISLVCKSTDKLGLKISYRDLYALYANKVATLSLTDEEWRTQYANNIPKIISLIYTIIEKLD